MALPTVQEPLYLFESPFANEGTKNIIPVTNNEATGLASQVNGFPAITQVPVEAGGIPPIRADFNGILYMLSAFAYWQQSGGLMTYKNTLQYAPLCVVSYNNILFMCIKANGVDTSAGVQPPMTNETDLNAEFWQYFVKQIGSLTEEEITDIVDREVGEAKATLVSSQTRCGLNELTFTSKVSATTLSIFAGTTWNSRVDNWSGSVTLTIKVNSNIVGTVTMASRIGKSGSKGHGWAYLPTDTTASSFDYKINVGDVVDISYSASGGYFNHTSIQVTLGA